ncbi:hypothetical protein WA026_004199 [Henosepilachna vigintioctopunctata]
MASVPPTLLKIGASLMHLGTFMSLSAAVRMIFVQFSTELMKVSKKQELIKHFLVACFLLNATLFFTTSVSGILINRMLYVVVNQVTVFCGQLTKNDSKEVGIHEKANVQMLVATLLSSAAVGSYIDIKGGFYTLVVIASFISGLQLVLIHQVEPEKDSKEKKQTELPTLGLIPKTFTNIFKSIRDIDIHFANWDALLIKSLLLSNAKVVCIFYVVMVIFVFRGNGALVCTTSAYQIVAITLSSLVYNKLNDKIVNLGNPREILEKSTILCAVSALVMGFSSTYIIYLLAFIPFIISRTFIQNYFSEVFEVTKNQKLRKDIETIAAITEIVCPVFIGMLFHLWRQNAYRVLAVAPFIVIYYIIRNKTSDKKYKKESSPKNVENNKDK